MAGHTSFHLFRTLDCNANTLADNSIYQIDKKKKMPFSRSDPIFWLKFLHEEGIFMKLEINFWHRLDAWNREISAKEISRFGNLPQLNSFCRYYAIDAVSFEMYFQ